MNSYQELLDEGDRYLNSAEPDCHRQALACYQKICNQYEHSPGRTGFRDIAMLAYAGIGDIYFLGSHGVPTDYHLSLLNYGKAVYAARFVTGGALLRAKIFISMGDINFMGGPKHPPQFAHALAYYLRALQHHSELEALSVGLVCFNIGDIFKTGQPFVMKADQNQAIQFYKLALGVNAISIMDRLEIYRSLVEIYANRKQTDLARTAAQNYLTTITEWYQNEAPELEFELKNKLVTQIKSHDRTVITEALKESESLASSVSAARSTSRSSSKIAPKAKPKTTVPCSNSPPPLLTPPLSHPPPTTPSTSTSTPPTAKRSRQPKRTPTQQNQDPSPKRLDRKHGDRSPGRISIPGHVIQMVPQIFSRSSGNSNPSLPLPPAPALPTSSALPISPAPSSAAPPFLALAEESSALDLYLEEESYSKEPSALEPNAGDADEILLLPSISSVRRFEPEPSGSFWPQDINYILSDPYDRFF